VRIDYDDGVVAGIETFWQRANRPQCGLDLGDVEPDLSLYKGDTVIRKFPYDPLEWYYETDSIV
jgi:primary-amine oxidase